MINRLLVVCTALVGSLSACDRSAPADASGGDASIPAEQPSIRGVITAREAGSIRVETEPADDSGSPKAVIRLVRDAAVVYRSGGAARAPDLTVGQEVSVWFEGPVAESYPVQASARTIVIEPSRGPVVP